MSVEVRRRDIAGGILIILALIIWILSSVPASPFSPAIALSNPPPGTGSGGITDTNELLSTHQNVLEDESYHLLLIHGLSRGKKAVVKSKPNRRIIHRNNGYSQVTTYIVEGQAYSRITSDDEETEFRYQQYTYRYNHQNPIRTTDALSNIILDYTFRPTQTKEKNGQRLIRFELVGGEYADGYLVIREDGLITNADVSTRTTSIKMDFDTTSDVTVKSPTWTEKARQAEKDSSDSGSDSCTDAEDGDNDGWCGDEWI